MKHNRIFWWSCIACLGTLIVGCQAADVSPDVVPPQAEETDAEATSSATTPVPVLAGTVPELAATDADGPIAAQASTADAPFSPPFPDRSELFEPPKRAASTIRRDEEHGDTVELKGFVHVDEPRVVLSIDGVVSPIPEGGEKYGVQVISIQPPSVVLQRGRSRWTATLE